MLASLCGHEVIVRLLLARGAKVGLAAGGGRLCGWLRSGNVLKQLCATPGVLWNREDLTPLALAIHCGRAACEAVLREHSAPK